jgi:hypothetical protein
VQLRGKPEREAATPGIDDRITAALAGADRPQPFSELRAHCRVRTATLYQRLTAMTAARSVIKAADGYHLARS